MSGDVTPLQLSTMLLLSQMRRVPSGSVVVAGSLPAADGSHSLYCAVIVKRVDAKTRSKTGINELLRE